MYIVLIQKTPCQSIHHDNQFVLSQKSHCSSADNPDLSNLKPTKMSLLKLQITM